MATAGVAVAIVLASSTASAFCRTRTCDPRAEACNIDENGCVASGEFLFWATNCVSYGIESSASPLRAITYDTASIIITRAYRQWISADCDATDPEPDYPAIEIADMGAIDCRRPEYNQTSGNANVWMFRDQNWPYDGADATLALTTITFNTLNGEIYDADVEINSSENQLTVGDSEVLADLESIVTHETGHFMGLSHTNVPGATMTAAYRTGQTVLRSLDPDDIGGICAIYPNNRPVEVNRCQPRHGFSRECSADESSTCSAVTVARPEPARSAQWLPLAMAAVVAVALGVRRGQRNHAVHRTR
jgi:hypothetical protein